MNKVIIGLLLTFTSLSALAQNICSISVITDEYSSHTRALGKALSIRGYKIVESNESPEYIARESCETSYHDCSNSRPMLHCGVDKYSEQYGMQTGISADGNWNRNNGRMSPCLPSFNNSCQPFTSVDSCALTITKATGELVASFTVGGGEFGFLGGWKKFKLIPDCPSAN